MRPSPAPMAKPVRLIKGILQRRLPSKRRPFRRKAVSRPSSASAAKRRHPMAKSRRSSRVNIARDLKKNHVANRGFNSGAISRFHSKEVTHGKKGGYSDLKGVKGGIVLALPGKAALGFPTGHDVYGIVKKSAQPLPTCVKRAKHGTILRH